MCDNVVFTITTTIFASMIHKLRIILTNITVEWFIWKIIPRILPVLSYSHAVVVSQAVISQAVRLPDTPVVIVPEASIRPLKLPGHFLPSNQHYPGCTWTFSTAELRGIAQLFFSTNTEYYVHHCYSAVLDSAVLNIYK